MEYMGFEGGGGEGMCPAMSVLLHSFQVQVLIPPSHVSTGLARGWLVSSSALCIYGKDLAAFPCVYTSEELELWKAFAVVTGMLCPSIDVASRDLDELFEQFACLQAVCTLSR